MTASEMDRLRGCLERLLPHVDRGRIALTGGVALELALAERGLSGWRDVIADVDFVAASSKAVASSLARGFLVSHFHMPQPGYSKFLIQVVDPVSRLRIDIFPDSAGALPRAKRTIVGLDEWMVLDPACMLDHKLEILAGASETAPVDEKHLRDALALAVLCGRAVSAPPAGRFAGDVHLTDLDAGCARCERSRDPDFPLAAKREIFDLLGYV